MFFLHQNDIPEETQIPIRSNLLFLTTVFVISKYSSIQVQIMHTCLCVEYQASNEVGSVSNRITKSNC